MLLFIILVLYSNVTSAEIIESQRAEIPYSSSYLPFNKADLLHKINPSRFQCNDEQCKVLLPNGSSYLVNKQIVKKSSDVLSRKFTLIAEEMSLMTPVQSKKIGSFLDKKFNQPNAEDWNGVCNQWSFGSQHPEIHKLVEYTQGMMCNDYFLSQGEIKELFTAFYHDIKASDVYGFRNDTNYKKLKLNNDKNDILLARKVFDEMVGEDDFPAISFHQNLHKNLKKNNPLVIDTFYGHEKWNRPVLSALSKIAELKSDFYKNDKNVLISPDLFTMKGNMTEKEKKSFECLKALYNGTFDFFNDQKHDVVKKMLNQKRLECSKSLSISQEKRFEVLVQAKSGNIISEFALMTQTEDLLRKIYHEKFAALVKDKKITLIEDIELRKITTKVKVIMNTDFTSSGKKEKEIEYKYIGIFENGKMINSYWNEPLVRRPDYMVVPKYEKISSLLKSMNQNPGEVAFTSLFKFFEKCVDITDIMEFAALQEKKKHLEALTEGELKRLQELTPKAGRYIESSLL